MTTGYIERIGTTGNDSIRFHPNEAWFGGKGNDSFLAYIPDGIPVAEDYSRDGVVQVGGSGDDSYGNYYVFSGLVIVSDEGNSTNDRYSNSNGGAELSTSTVAIIDNRHLLIVPKENSASTLIIDWLTPKNAIESFYFNDGTYSLAQFQQKILTLPGYLGNKGYAELGFTPQEVSEINVAIGEIATRAAQIEGAATPSPTPTPTPPAGGGTSGNDVISGNDSNETLFGYEGNDQIFGFGGNDLINGNQGADTLNGNLGDDSVSGGKDNDWVFGGQGNDVVNGNLGDDIVNGNKGNDTVYGGQGNDTIYGGEGNDLLYGDLGSDRIYGGKGNDTMIGGIELDYFVITLSDTANGPQTDVIQNYQSGGDRIVFEGTGLTKADLTIRGTSSNADGIVQTTVTYTLNGYQHTLLVLNDSPESTDFMFT